MRSIENSNRRKTIFNGEYSREITLFYAFTILKKSKKKNGNNATNAKMFDVNTVTILFFISPS